MTPALTVVTMNAQREADRRHRAEEQKKQEMDTAQDMALDQEETSTSSQAVIEERLHKYDTAINTPVTLAPSATLIAADAPEDPLQGIALTIWIVLAAFVGFLAHAILTANDGDNNANGKRD